MTDLGFFNTKTELMKNVTPAKLDKIGVQNGYVNFNTIFPDWRENATFRFSDYKNGMWTNSNRFPKPLSSEEVIEKIVGCMTSDDYMKGVSVYYSTPELRSHKVRKPRKNTCSCIKLNVGSMF